MISIVGFTLGYHEGGFAVLLYNDIRLIHLWEANPKVGVLLVIQHQLFRVQNRLLQAASCRIEVEGRDELYQEILPLDILHPNAKISDRWWGVRDFGITDPDNNLIEFFENLK